MNKAELIAEVATRNEISKVESEKIVNAVLDTIVETVANGDKVQIVGFGSFEKKTRAARKGRNPKTGEEITIAESTTPHFKAGKAFKTEVAGK